MKYRGVFFDFDYTLGDSTPAIAEGYRLGFAALGLDPPTVAQVRPTIGLTLADGYSLITGDHDPERQETFFRTFQETVGVRAQGAGRTLMIEGTTLFPGAAELLEALKSAGVRTAIVSTKPGDTIRRIFEHQERLDLLDLVIGGDEVHHSKPNPEGLGLALDKPLVAVETLAALAYNLYDTGGLICPIMDARRQQVYTGIYRFAGHRLETVAGQEAIGIDELLKKLESLGEAVTFLGDGVPVFRQRIEEKLRRPFCFVPPHLSRQRAGAVGALGMQYYKEGKIQAAAAHRPEYLRVSQAERERVEREKRAQEERR